MEHSYLIFKTDGKWFICGIDGIITQLSNEGLGGPGGSISWEDILDKPLHFLFEGDKIPFSDIINVPTTSWNDLTDKPTLFEGPVSYDDLTDKPAATTLDNLAGYETTGKEIKMNTANETQALGVLTPGILTADILEINLAGFLKIAGNHASEILPGADFAITGTEHYDGSYIVDSRNEIAGNTNIQFTTNFEFAESGIGTIDIVVPVQVVEMGVFENKGYIYVNDEAVLTNGVMAENSFIEVAEEKKFNLYGDIRFNNLPLEVTTSLIYRAILTPQPLVKYMEPTILTVGETYQIETLEAGDDFSNVGYVDNTPFVATDTTPTDWTHGTVVTFITATPAIDVNEVQNDLRLAINWDRELYNPGSYIATRANGSTWPANTFIQVSGAAAEGPVVYNAVVDIFETHNINLRITSITGGGPVAADVGPLHIKIEIPWTDPTIST